MKRSRSETPRTLLLARPEAVAGLLGTGRSTIYELMRAGELPVVHVDELKAIRRYD